VRSPREGLNSVRHLVVGQEWSGAIGSKDGRPAPANELATGGREQHVKGDHRPSGAGPISLNGKAPLVVPVLSAAGGTGRSTVAAILAAVLNNRTVDPQNRAVAVCDSSPRAASPWPDWVDRTAEHGTAWLASCAGDADRFAREVRRSTSALKAGPDGPIWVLTDTGAMRPEFAGADPGPRFWAPVLQYLRAAVIDADSLEAFRLVRQQANGELSNIAAWMADPGARTAAVWVTDPSPAGVGRTLRAMTAAEQCGLPMGQFVVAINDHRGHGWASRARSRRTLLADRVGAIVELRHQAALLRDGWPPCPADQLVRRDAADLLTAVIAAADGPAAAAALPPVAGILADLSPAVVPAAHAGLIPAPSGRTPRHAATSARAIPAGH
jgi:hypothetical protein